MPTDCLARGPWGAGIAWQARRPSYGLRRCARRGALVSQSPTIQYATQIKLMITVILINEIKY